MAQSGKPCLSVTLGPEKVSELLASVGTVGLKCKAHQECHYLAALKACHHVLIAGHPKFAE